MSTATVHRPPPSLVAMLTVLIVALGGLSAWLGYRSFWEGLELAFAEDQTAIFAEMREKAVQGSATRAAEALEYAVNYYPSGSKQRTGSRMDRIVERQRASTVREIIAHLRRVTGQDLGDAPDAWIKQFARP